VARFGVAASIAVKWANRHNEHGSAATGKARRRPCGSASTRAAVSAPSPCAARSRRRPASARLSSTSDGAHAARQRSCCRERAVTLLDPVKAPTTERALPSMSDSAHAAQLRPCRREHAIALCGPIEAPTTERAFTVDERRRPCGSAPPLLP
jgi:hypothetical protein